MSQEQSGKPESAGEVPLGTEAVAATASPLAGVNPRSLDALMAEDPAKLQDADFDRIIEAQRALRRTWAENEAKKEAKPPADPNAPKAPRARGPKVSIDLDTLFAEKKS